MRLDRNENPTGGGKYALLHLRRARAAMTPEVSAAIAVLDKAGLIEWGKSGEADEFFVIKLKDKYARGALVGYLEALTGEEEYDCEYALDIQGLARRSGPLSPWCKKPD